MAKELKIKVNKKLWEDVQTRSAEFSMSVQDYVTELLERNLYPERFPQISEDQREKIWEAMQVIEEALEDMTDVLQEDYEQVEGGAELTMEQCPGYPEDPRSRSAPRPAGSGRRPHRQFALTARWL